MAETDSTLHRILLAYLEHSQRGAATELCQHTSLTLSDISNWTAGRRRLSDPKLVEAMSWLIDSHRLSIESHA